MPSSFTSTYLPVNGRSVPWRRRTWYCSGVSSARHSASVLSIFCVIGLRSGPWVFAGRRRVSLGLRVVFVRVGCCVRVRLAHRCVQRGVRVAVRVCDRGLVLGHERAVALVLLVGRALMRRLSLFLSPSW